MDMDGFQALQDHPDDWEGLLYGQCPYPVQPCFQGLPLQIFHGDIDRVIGAQTVKDLDHLRHIGELLQELGLL